MKKKMARAKLALHKDGNPPRQTRGAEKAKLIAPIVIVTRTQIGKDSGEI